MLKNHCLASLVCVLALCTSFAKAGLHPVDTSVDDKTKLATEEFTIPEGFELQSITAYVPLDLEAVVKIFNDTSSATYQVNSDPYSGVVTWAFDLVIDGQVMGTLNGKTDFSTIFPEESQIPIEQGKKVLSNTFNVSLGKNTLEVLADKFTDGVPETFTAELVLSSIGYTLNDVSLPSGFLIGAENAKLKGEIEMKLVEKEITSTPEPATLTVIGLGLLGTALAARRRIKK